MLRYTYTAARGDGSLVRGVLDAASSSHASATLADRGLHPLRLEAVTVDTELRPAASRRDLAVVFRSLASLVGAGVPVGKALAATVPVARGPLRPLLVTASDELRAGRTLAQALATGQGIVPSLALGMLRAGERASRLGTALEEIATQLEREAELVGRIRQALAYPLLLAVAGLVSVLVISTVVVPKFAVMLADLGQALPPATRVLLASSTLVSRHGLVLLVIAAVAVCLSTMWIRRPQGQLSWHTTLLSLPGIGPLRLLLASARGCHALGSALRAGMPLLPALEVAQDAVGDRAVARRVLQARERVSQGQTLTAAVSDAMTFAPIALQLLAVGESSGELASMAGRAGDLAAQEAERGIKTLIGLVEPGLVVFFGGLVAFVAAALLQAVYSLRPGGM